jgi:AcrR family transcriptional regulator
MTDELDPRVRAGETKKRRTREKLINAAAAVMAERGLDATVEEIAEDAGVSTPTFYTFYKSRGALCVDAFTTLVVEVLERTMMPATAITDRVIVARSLAGDHPALLRAALMERLENPTVYPEEPGKGTPLRGIRVCEDDYPEHTDGPPPCVRAKPAEVHDFVDRVACELWEVIRVPQRGTWTSGDVADVLHMVALDLLDASATGRVVFIDAPVNTIERSARARLVK